MTPETRYKFLGELLATQPKFPYDEDLDDSQHLWLGRLTALLDTDVGNSLMLQGGIAKLNSMSGHEAGVREIRLALYNALAKAEMLMPAAMQGAFIQVGGSFDALANLSKVVTAAKQNVLIVDPYADESVLSKFGLLVPEHVLLRVLSDSQSVKANLKPATQAWMQQYQTTRPLEVRLTAPRVLHDRLIITDDNVVWVLTQSLKDFAVRSPGSITRVDTETAKLKVTAYGNYWTVALPI